MPNSDSDWGATTSEYALLIGLIAAGAVASVELLGISIASLLASEPLLDALAP